MAGTARYTAGDYTKALALLVVHAGNINKFRPAGLPSYPGIVGRAMNHPAMFKAEYEAAIAKRNEHFGLKRVRCVNVAYSEEQYAKALRLFSEWMGQTNDFKPEGLPQYFTLSSKARKSEAFREKFATAQEARLKLGRSIGGKRVGRAVYSPEDYSKFVDAIRGSNLSNVTAFKLGSRLGLPSWWAAHRFAKTNPEFAKKLDEALQAKGWSPSPRGVNRRAPSRGLPPGRQPHTDHDYDRYIEAIRQSACLKKSDFIKQKLKGLPRWETVVRWARKNPGFAQRVSEALKARGWKDIREVFGYTDAHYFQSIAMLAKFKGASAHSFAPKNLPAYLALTQRAANDPRIAKALEASKKARFNLLLELGLPIAKESGFGRYYPRRISDDEKASYIAAIEDGLTQNKLMFAKGALITWAVRKRLMSEDPEFAASIVRANRIRLERQFAASKARLVERWKKYNALRSKRFRTDYEVGQLRIRLDLNDYYAAARASLANFRQIPEFDLEDIRTDMVEAMINGTLLPEEAAERAFEYVGAHKRMFSPHKNKSLDQRRFEDGNATVGDYITTDAYSYAE